MTPDQRSAVRAGCNLATLPAGVRAELQEELQACRDRYKFIQRKASELYGMRGNRFRVERGLEQLGDMGPAVKAALNRLISGSKQRDKK